MPNETNSDLTVKNETCIIIDACKTIKPPSAKEIKWKIPTIKNVQVLTDKKQRYS